MTRRIIVGTFAISLLLTAAAAVAAPPPVAAVTVYVMTRPAVDGFTDPDSQRRADSVNDLKGKLTGRKGLQVVDAADAAAVVIEVLGRGYVDTGSTSTKIFGGAFGPSATTSKVQEKDLAVKLKAGATYETEIHSDRHDLIAWRMHAGVVADKVEKWIKENRAALTKQE